MERPEGPDQVSNPSPATFHQEGPNHREKPAKAQEEKAKFEQELRALLAKAAARKLPPVAAPSAGVQAPIISSPAGATHVAPGHVQSASANMSAAQAQPSGFVVPGQPAKMANALLLDTQTQQANAERGTSGIV